jgi:hypothetical protein
MSPEPLLYSSERVNHSSLSRLLTDLWTEHFGLPKYSREELLASTKLLKLKSVKLLMFMSPEKRDS